MLCLVMGLRSNVTLPVRIGPPFSQFTQPERLHATLDTRLPPSLPSSLCPTEVCCSLDTMLKANMESCQQPGHHSKAEDQRRKKNQEGGGKTASLLTFASNTRLRGERLPGQRSEPRRHTLGCRGGMHHFQNRRAAGQ